MLPDTTLRYDRGTIALHWLTAFLVVGLWVVGQTADWLPKGPVRGAYWSTHVVVGFALVAVIAVRLLWRFTKGRQLPDATLGLSNTLAKLTHHALYGLLVVILALGLANAIVRGFHLYGVTALPQIGDPAWKGLINRLHSWGSDLLLVAAGGHALAALWHHFVQRDDVLRRMWA